jgi:hypothetical protein
MGLCQVWSFEQLFLQILLVLILWPKLTQITVTMIHCRYKYWRKHRLSSEKILISSAKFRQKSAVRWISRIYIDILQVKQSSVHYNKISHCLFFSVQNIRIHFIFTLQQQSCLCQLSYCAVCMLVSDCTTAVTTLQTVPFTLMLWKSEIYLIPFINPTWLYTYLQLLSVQ